VKHKSKSLSKHGAWWKEIEMFYIDELLRSHQKKEAHRKKIGELDFFQEMFTIRYISFP